MKTLPFQFFLILLLLQACGESPDKEKNEGLGPTIVKGTIGTSSEGKVLLKMRKGVFTYEDSIVGSSPLDKGSFRIVLDLERASYLALEAPSRGTLIFLEPGDSLVVRKGMERGYRFEGEGALPNVYIQKKKEFRDSIGRRSDSLFEVEKKVFEEKFMKRKQDYRAFRQRYFGAEGKEYGDRFEKLERQRDRIELAILQFSYPDIYLYENPNDTVSFSDRHWAFLDSMDLNDPILLYVPDYLSFAYDVANKYTLDNKGEHRNKSYREMLFRTIQEEFEGEVEEALLTYFILEQSKYAPERVTETFWERYKKEVKDPEKRAFVKRKLRKVEGKGAL